MKKIVILFFILVNASFFGQEEAVILNNYSFEEAYQLQKKEKRPIITFFHTDWCKYCFAMKKNTFTNNDIIQLLNTRFYFVSFDAETKDSIVLDNTTFKNKSGTHQIVEALATIKGNISYPTTVILSPTNTIDEQINSFLPSRDLKSILKKYLR